MTTSERPIRHETGIQWTHVPGYVGATWNPTVGCTRVSPGCDNCYAFTLHDQRYAANLRATRDSGLDALPGPAAISFARAQGVKLPLPPQYDRPFSQVQLLDDQRLEAPLHTKHPHAYFVDSMSDLFHEDVPDEFIDRVFDVMAMTPRHLYMILTKRPERMRDYVQRHVASNRNAAEFWSVMEGHKLTPVWPLPNVWLGTSIEDQQRADERVPLLLDTPAALRFLSCEPLLGPIDLHPRPSRDLCIRCGLGPQAPHPHPDGYRTRGLDWVLIGGESGLHARPFDLAWARSIVAQCRTAGAVPFVKQLGAHPVSVIKADTHKVVTGTAPIAPQPWRVMLHNRHGSDPTEWPEDLRVREFPVLI